MTEIATVPETAITIGSSEAKRPVRRKMMELLNHLPNTADTVTKMSPGDTLRVVMSHQENAHSFHQGANGLWRTALREHGRFVESAGLARVGPDILTLGAEKRRRRGQRRREYERRWTRPRERRGYLGRRKSDWNSM